MGTETPNAKIKNAFPIGYVALATGLSPHVIRVWERRYQAVAPVREGKKRRLYSQNDIDRLKELKRACMRGRRIGSVAMLDEGALHRMNRNDQSAFFCQSSKMTGTSRLMIHPNCSAHARVQCGIWMLRPS
jgi:DNA-binding transcriptional MerR regulator